MKIQMQSESAECGLACLQMILSVHGDVGDISELRRRFNVGLKGATLRQLMQLSGELQLSARALSLSLEELPQLQLPCILHWDLNHFVVLSKVGRKAVTIFEPPVGKRRPTLPLQGVETAARTGHGHSGWQKESERRNKIQPGRMSFNCTDMRMID